MYDMYFKIDALGLFYFNFFFNTKLIKTPNNAIKTQEKCQCVWRYRSLTFENNNNKLSKRRKNKATGLVSSCVCSDITDVFITMLSVFLIFIFLLLLYFFYNRRVCMYTINHLCSYLQSVILINDVFNVDWSRATVSL